MSRFVPCPQCGTDEWYVTETRHTERGIRRRRRCCECDHGMTSWEVLAPDLAAFKSRKLDQARNHAQKALQILDELEQRHA